MHIRFDNADLRFGDRVALQPLSLSLVEPPIGVIGLNGSGKTSFARLIAGLAKPSSGKAARDRLVGEASFLCTARMQNTELRHEI